MHPLTVYKASAGSGKTFTLAVEFIKLLILNPRKYENILAVTFTNKATEEMKHRIVSQLYGLSHGLRSSDSYLNKIMKELDVSEDFVRKNADIALHDLLHNYNQFRVQTIDAFFQGILRNMVKELGLGNNLRISLNDSQVISEAVDSIMETLDKDKALMSWIIEYVNERMDDQKSWDITGEVKSFGMNLSKEFFKSNEHLLKSIANDKDFFKRYKKAMTAIIRGAEAHFKECGEYFLTMLSDAGYDVTDLAFGRTGVAGYFLKLKDGDFIKDNIVGARVQAAMNDPMKWGTKKNASEIAPLAESQLIPYLIGIEKERQAEVPKVRSAIITLKNINKMRLLFSIREEMDRLNKENARFMLSNTQMVLSQMIQEDTNIAPFIYEKLGVRFEHFLLDEFQDTSKVQWENFKPLISNSDASGNENLLVGDVKQSIYRWRGSDWKLMAKDVAEEFPGAVNESLEGNWRSLRNIVEFNNSFFRYAAAELDRIYGHDASISVSSIYGGDSSKGQEVMTGDPSEGLVEAVFCPQDAQDDHILDTICKVIDSGAKPGDITVLVRNNQEGSEVAGFLMDKGIDVISDDSLHLKSSFMVRKLVSLISSVKNPDDTIGSYLATKAGLEAGKISFHSLPDLCEQLLRLLQKNEDPEIMKDETLYIQSFMDYVQDHVASNGNSLDAFLKAWDEADPKVSSPSDVNAVRVMTIHKAKGLEFPYVIFPYSEKVTLFKAHSSGTVPSVDGTPLQDIGNTAFDVTLSSGSASTLFEKDYRQELLLQYIDNINTYYVALTRASKGMTIISDIDSKPEGSFAGLLRGYLEGFGASEGFSEESDNDEEVMFRKGSMYDFSRLERKEEDITGIEPGFPSFPLNPEGEEGTERGRLRVSTDAADFFTAEGMARAEARHNGTVLHDILSRVRVPSDLEPAVLQAVRDGELEPERKDDVLRLLSERISSRSEWFPVSGTAILNETSLFDTDGREWRPDRVVIRDGKVTVIDYKFGEHNPHYRKQVARYAAIYRRLGYEDVSTAIWYVPSDEVD